MARKITTEELRQHASPKDCWIAVRGKVYDVSLFLSEHPGGGDVVLDKAGSDATIEFDETGHTDAAVELMKQYYVADYDARLHDFIFLLHQRS